MIEIEKNSTRDSQSTVQGFSITKIIRTIAENPGCEAVIDKNCWWLLDKDGDTLLYSDGDNDLLEALELMIKMEKERT